MHSIYAPSSAFRWVECHASATMEAMYPNEETEESREGEAAHWVAAELFLGRNMNAKTAPNGVEIDDDMRFGAELWHTTVMAHHEIPHVEERLPIPRVHSECFGTPDTWTYNPVKRVLRVYDYKYGFGVVEVFENWQCLAYVCGLLDIIGAHDQEVIVEITIIQPRAFHRDGPVRNWTVKASTLRGYFNRLHAAANDQEPGFKSGAHCLHCKHRHNCEAAGEAALSAFEYVRDARTVELSNGGLAFELEVLRRARDAIEARLTGLEVEAFARLSQGNQVNGWALEASYGRTKWNVPAEEVVIIGEMMGFDLKKPVDCITPKQAEKLGIDKAVIQSYSVTPSAGLKLVSDKSLIDKARAAFGVLNHG